MGVRHMPIRDWKKEICTIPNLLSVFRLLLIPVYIYIYLNATEAYHYAIAAGILAVSCLTDLIDGKIARKFNMISHVGKLLDPIADKATQFALIICLSVSFPALKALLALFVIKESFQLIETIMNLRRGKALDGALLSGKISTTVLFIGLIILVLCPWLDEKIIWFITGVCGIFMLIAFIDYIRAFCGKDKKVHDLK